MALSAFAGMYNAVEFAYGWPGSKASALQVTQGSTSTGAYTIVCAPALLQTSDGLTIPISTTTPITIGSDSGIETVTPSAVSTDNLGRLLITATFTNAHGTGAQVRSGDAGLGEALLFAGNHGGGEVIISPTWGLTGGTQALLNGATVPSGVTIVDNRGGSGLSSSTIVLSNAQILAMNTTPVQLLANADANTMYYIVQAVVVNQCAGVAYASGGAITIGWGTTTATTAALTGSTIAATFLTTPTVHEVTTLAGVVLATTSTASTYAGKGIWVTCATGNFTTGTGTLAINLTYVKVPA